MAVETGPRWNYFRLSIDGFLASEAGRALRETSFNHVEFLKRILKLQFL